MITTETQQQVNLYEDDGTPVSVITPSYPKKTLSTSSQIVIGQNFNGIINGVKYYKTSSPPTNGIYAMKYGYDMSSNCLLYFMFSQ